MSNNNKNNNNKKKKKNNNNNNNNTNNNNIFNDNKSNDTRSDKTKSAESKDQTSLSQPLTTKSSSDQMEYTVTGNTTVDQSSICSSGENYDKSYMETETNNKTNTLDDSSDRSLDSSGSSETCDHPSNSSSSVISVSSSSSSSPSSSSFSDSSRIACLSSSSDTISTSTIANTSSTKNTKETKNEENDSSFPKINEDDEARLISEGYNYIGYPWASEFIEWLAKRCHNCGISVRTPETDGDYMRVYIGKSYAYNHLDWKHLGYEEIEDISCEIRQLGYDISVFNFETKDGEKSGYYMKMMSSDPTIEFVDNMTEKQLIVANKKICERLRAISKEKSRKLLKENTKDIKKGEYVNFEGKAGKTYIGKVTKVNQKTISVTTTIEGKEATCRLGPNNFKKISKSAAKAAKAVAKKAANKEANN
jgi:hypothetical protein